MGGYRMSLIVMATRLTLPASWLSTGAEEIINSYTASIINIF